MKLIFAIVAADAVDTVSKALVGAHFSVTHISTVSGLFKRGVTTMVIGVDAAQLEEALNLIRSAAATLSKPDFHAATIFVVNAGEYRQI